MARQRRSRKEWQRLIEEFEGCGLTQQQFATKRGLNAKTLENWAYRLRREAREAVAPVQFLPVSVRATAPRAAVASSTAAHEGGIIEVVVGQDVRVRFAPGVDCDYLGRLLAAVTRSAAC